MDTPAAASVLTTPELLETILLDVDMTTLLVSAQRVSKFWLAVILSSSKLQQALFFQPTPAPANSRLVFKKSLDTDLASYPINVNVNVKDEDKDENDDDDYDEEDEDDDDCDKDDGDDDDDYDAPVVVALLNPLLLKYFGEAFFKVNDDLRSDLLGADDTLSDFLPWKGSHRRKRNCCNELESKIASKRLAFTRAGSSWRRMLVSQPPPTPILSYAWEYFGEPLDTSSEGHIVQPSVNPLSSLSSSCSSLLSSSSSSLKAPRDGLRFGLLYDLVQNTASQERDEEYDIEFWFQVFWNIGTSLSYEHLFDKILKPMLLEKSVVVQLCKRQDEKTTWRMRNSVKLLEEDFKCDDFHLPDHELRKACSTSNN